MLPSVMRPLAGESAKDNSAHDWLTQDELNLPGELTHTTDVDLFGDLSTDP